MQLGAIWLSVCIFCICVAQASGQAAAKDSIKNSFSKNFLLVPIVIKSPETKWGFGYASAYFFRVKKGDTITRTSNVESIGLLTTRRQQILMLGLNLFSPNEKYIFKVRSTYSKFPDKYWGKGDRTPSSNAEQYGFTQFFINPQLLRRVYSKIYVGAIYELQLAYNMRYQSNRLYDKTVTFGKDGGASSGLGIIAAWDTRNNAFSPNHGAFFQFSVLQFSPATFSNFRFTNAIIDVRKYIKLSWRNVLAVQAYGYFTAGDTPFRYLGALGGPDNLRGYYAGRYRDNNQIHLQAEYRFHVIWRFGMVVFAGVGDVSDKVLKYRFSPLKYSLGTGLRIALKPHEKLNLRIDYGFGYHSRAMYITVSEAF